jgi:poly(hydroxyalkanoate) depolymerase family esterase
MKIRLAISLFFVSAGLLAQSGFFSVSGFGSNPGNLNMYAYVPPGLSGPRPLVVALHGCSQNASTFATETGWNTLALRHSFYVIYPEQNTANNASGCFNWFQPADYTRNQGEAYSIKQMVDHMRTNYNIDSNQVFVTGLSAGGCMTSVMLACYPEVFNKGAVMAGCPYQSASNSSQAVSAMQGAVTNTPAGWAALVTGAYPGYTGAYPQIAIFHGSADNVVNIGNQTELMKQWTGVHQANQTADLTLNAYNGNSFISKNMYADNNGLPVVETYTINGMYHGIALDTGQCYQQCGKTGTFSYEVLFSSTFFAAHFFNILAQPYGITRPFAGYDQSKRRNLFGAL